MASESSRGIRGWVYAVAVAICLLLLFMASDNFARIKRPGFYHAPRTATLSVSTKPKTIPRIATEAIPLEIASLERSIDATTWMEYRRENQASISLLEPPAGARLSAPIAPKSLDDPFALNTSLAQGFQNRSSVSESSPSTTATLASAISASRHLPAEMDEQVAIDETTAVRSQASPFSSRGWPVSSKMQSEIESLSQKANQFQSDSTKHWLLEVRTVYNDLSGMTINDEASIETLERFHALFVEGTKLSESVLIEAPDLATEISRVAYSIERRYAVWNAVARCVSKSRSQLVSARKHEVDSSKLLSCLSEVERAIVRTGDPNSWNKYLMLDSLRGMANTKISGTQNEVDLARQFLSRVTDSRVSEAQRAVLTSTEVHRLADQLHPLSIGPVNYKRLIDDIETLESDPVHPCSRTLADAMQSLRFSEHPEQVAVSHAIGNHYRNANLRIAVSEDFINRMMPKTTVSEKPVKQTILGADTRGISQISTQLTADFLPSESSWKVALRLNGDISSNTRSSRNGAAFYNSTVANVNAVREVNVSLNGLSINGTPATVESRDSLRRFSTDWDALPILGDMVRRYAHDEFLQSKPIAKRIMQRTIAKQTDEEFDNQLRTKVNSAQSQFERRLIGPLQQLDLHPMVMDMQTTDTRLVVRYRVAGTDQLSANTPRPLAPSDSLLSLQVHQSAFNNLASQVVSGDREWTMQDLSDKISDLLQQPRKPIAADAPTDVTIRFNEARPITVEFEDGRMWLTLRISHLEQPGRIQIKNFIIRTSYLPTIEGLKGELARDGVISVDGQRLGVRDRLPLRAIFSRVFANRGAVPMVSDELAQDPRAIGLAVSQLELRDGWLAVAISRKESPHVALFQANQPTVSR